MSDLARHRSFSETQKKFVRIALESDLDLTRSAGSSEQGVDEDEIREVLGKFRNSKMFSDDQIKILEELMFRKLRKHGMF